MAKKRPTPSTLEEWEHFPTVGDDVAQMRLARAMGYPPSWRVVRDLVPVPVPEHLAKQHNEFATERGARAVCADDAGFWMMTTVMDRIYAGAPATQPDGYYNHAAALLASSKLPWRPEYDDVIHDNDDDDYDDADYCSTSHRNKGGQLKGREARFEEGDIVEVLYDEDEDEDPAWYEATILKKIEYQDDIRYDVHYKVDDALQGNVREDKIRATKKTKKKAAPRKPRGKKQAAARAKEEGPTDSPPAKKKRGRPPGKKNKAQKKEKAAAAPPAADPPRDDVPLDDGDPPWRTAGHAYLGRRVRWTPPPEDAGAAAAPPRPCLGTVVAWIAATDVDRAGDPGFVCSRTGRPARLFHAAFDELGQDLEEWELKECLLDDDEEGA